MNGLAGAIKKIVKSTLPAPIYRMVQKEYWRLKGELYDEKKFKKKMLAERKTLPVKTQHACYDISHVKWCVCI